MKRVEILKELIKNHELQDYEIEELNKIISSSIGIDVGDEVYVVIDSKQEQPIISTVVKINTCELEDNIMHLVQANDIENGSMFFSDNDKGKILFTSLTDAEAQLKEIKV